MKSPSTSKICCTVRVKCKASSDQLLNALTAMKVALNLLLNKPEQEKALLVLLVNKLGDPK